MVGFAIVSWRVLNFIIFFGGGLKECKSMASLRDFTEKIVPEVWVGVVFPLWLAAGIKRLDNLLGLCRG